MPTFPTSLLWRLTDREGYDQALLDDSAGLRARGTVVAAVPLPHTCRYELTTDPDWATTRLDVTTEGAGWLRTVRLQRTGQQWRVTTSEQGNLRRAMTAAGKPPADLPGMEDPDRLTEALDVDLVATPLFNTLPVRRLGLLDAEPGTTHTLTVAWVGVPSLEVIASEQTYTALGNSRVRYADDSFTAELTLDDAGYVTHYPGLADRHTG